MNVATQTTLTEGSIDSWLHIRRDLVTELETARSAANAAREQMAAVLRKLSYDSHLASISLSPIHGSIIPSMETQSTTAQQQRFLDRLKQTRDHLTSTGNYPSQALQSLNSNIEHLRQLLEERDELEPLLDQHLEAVKEAEDALAQHEASRPSLGGAALSPQEGELAALEGELDSITKAIEAAAAEHDNWEAKSQAFDLDEAEADTALAVDAKARKTSEAALDRMRNEVTAAEQQRDRAAMRQRGLERRAAAVSAKINECRGDLNEARFFALQEVESTQLKDLAEFLLSDKSMLCKKVRALNETRHELNQVCPDGQSYEPGGLAVHLKNLGPHDGFLSDRIDIPALNRAVI